MTLRERRKLLIALFAAFIIFGGGIAFYAQGWRIAPGNFAIQKVGAVYVRSFPGDAAVYLDGKRVQNRGPWFFGEGTLINNLFPGSYKLALTAPEYLDWRQTLSVSPSLVTETEFAVLIPSPSRAVLS